MITIDIDNYLDYSKINFGNVNRRVVYNAITQLLQEIDNPGLFNDKSIDWESNFSNFSI